MPTLDMHIHSTRSDGGLTTQSLIEKAQQGMHDLLIVTDHDAVNHEFSQAMHAQGLPLVEGVEITIASKEKELQEILGKRKWIHMTYYAPQVKQELLTLFQVLHKAKFEKAIKQVQTLEQNGFHISEADFLNYWGKNGAKPEETNFDLLHIAEYLYRHPENHHIIENTFGEDISLGYFVKQCLKSGGQYAELGGGKLPTFYPGFGEIAELVEDGIFCLAHPNVTFGNVQQFETCGEYLMENTPLKGIEINAKADEKRVDAILAFAKKWNLIVTFGSDFHRGSGDSTHGSFGEMNPFVHDEIILEEKQKFLTSL